jgi:choline dehydrogenase-like flavoprotein
MVECGSLNCQPKDIENCHLSVNESIYDVVIIGAGAVGASIARELSKTNLKTILLEKSRDVSQVKFIYFRELLNQTPVLFMEAMMMFMGV